MRINSLDAIWDNLGYVIQKHSNFKKAKKKLQRLVYNCSPIKLKDGSITNTYIEVGYLYLGSAVKDDSQGFIWFDCTNRINYDSEHKMHTELLPEQISDKILAKNNTKIAQIYNNDTKEYLKKDSNIEWHLDKGQALFTTLKEAEDYIKECETGNVDLKGFSMKFEKVSEEKVSEYTTEIHYELKNNE